MSAEIAFIEENSDTELLIHTTGAFDNGYIGYSADGVDQYIFANNTCNITDLYIFKDFNESEKSLLDRGLPPPDTQARSEHVVSLFPYAFYELNVILRNTLRGKLIIRCMIDSEIAQYTAN